MLWFIPFAARYVVVLPQFKYILCYGSSRNIIAKGLTAKLFKYILCYGSSVITVGVKTFGGTFKYILCYGSSSIISSKPIVDTNLNTSYVIVHRYRAWITAPSG